MLLYLFVPIYFSVSPVVCALHIMALTYVVRLSYSEQMTSEICNCIGLLIDVFLETAQNILPHSFFTINFHLITHLCEQLRASGPLHNYSMFPFEGGMKKMKGFCHGTVSYGKQIVESFLLYKELYFEIRQNVESYSQFSKFIDFVNLFNYKHVGDQRHLGNGVMFHSLEYKFRKSSVSYICFLTSGEFCEMTRFYSEDGQKKAFVKLYKTVSFLDYFCDNCVM